jgi:hypothetical protein
MSGSGHRGGLARGRGLATSAWTARWPWCEGPGKVDRKETMSTKVTREGECRSNADEDIVEIWPHDPSGTIQFAAEADAIRAALEHPRLPARRHLTSPDPPTSARQAFGHAGERQEPPAGVDPATY